jgi:hypothetical protein
LGHTDIIKECCIAAFYSESTLNNYLQLFELADYKDITYKAAQYVETLPESTKRVEYYYINQQLRVNNLSVEHKNVIRIFNGEFDYIYNECKKDKNILGWSSNFKGIAVPFLILILDKNINITKAGQKLIDGMKYRMGFSEKYGEDFSKIFLKWKRKLGITDEYYKKYVEWLKDEADKRVEAIVGGTHRKSYHKAAAIIVTLGEMLESNGELYARRDIIEHYKKIHSRKRAFKAEFEELN